MKLPRRDKHPNAHEDEFDVYFDKMDGEEMNFVGIDGKGDWFYVDPFVGCAWEYEKRKELLGKNAIVKGFWALQRVNGMPVFLVDEGGIKITD